MSTNTLNRDENSGTNLRSVGDYEYELNAYGTHTWTHTETGLTIEMSKHAGMDDGYGRINKGYAALARDTDGQVVDQIIRAGGAYLPSKADAWKAVRDWMQDRPDGELCGDEEVRF